MKNEESVSLDPATFLHCKLFRNFRL